MNRGTLHKYEITGETWEDEARGPHICQTVTYRDHYISVMVPLITANWTVCSRAYSDLQERKATHINSIDAL